MQNKLLSILFSTRLMALLFIVFAVAMGVGTFVESYYSTETARQYIYNAHWFEVIMVLFAINFFGNIFRYNLHKREKWSTLLLHMSFVLIIVGAGITRYIGFEGIMPIREGQATNKFMSEKTFLTFMIDGEVDGEALRRRKSEELLLAPKGNNDITINTDFKGDPISFKVVNYIHGAEEGFRETEDGSNYIKIVEAGGGNRHDHFIKEGEVVSIHNVLFAYNKPTDGAINITVPEDGSDYLIKTPFEGDFMRMADQFKGEVLKDSVQKLNLRSLYNVAGMQFVFPDPVVKGEEGIVETEQKSKGQADAVTLEVKANGDTKNIQLLGSKGRMPDPKKLEVGGYDIYLSYGSKEYELPFALMLKDFEAKKYPGTENNPTPSYQSFKSKVDIVDDGESVPYEIYMNHVLDKDGYRFFQASFDADEKGTILSVNHDFWGTWITYIGYFLLYLGLMLILFDKGSRFGQLKKMLDKVKAKKQALTILLVLSTALGFAQTTDDGHDHSDPNHVHEDVQEIDQERLDSLIVANAVSKEHAEEFGKMIIQDAGGRMKPANTYSSELLRKLSKADSYNGLTSDQVLISMLENPTVWYNIPLIHVERKNDSIRHITGVDEDAKLLPLAKFFDATGTYRLAPYLEDAYQAQNPTSFQKDFIKTDQKVNLLYSALEGDLLKIFPVPGAENNKWVSYPELKEHSFTGRDSVFAYNALPIYLTTLRQAKQTQGYAQATEVLETIKKFQSNHGAEIMPSDQKVKTEILYNKYDVFRNLFWMFMLAGLITLLFVILKIFYNNKFIKSLVLIGKIAIILLFIIHTAGLIARWYISGHAPWSDAYESMIYVAWATMFFGLAFGRKSDLTLASTAFVASMILMIAHWNWMDPAIANLVPVLDSYWLMIHVAVIVGSYGPFTLGMILGVVSLLLMIFTNSNNKAKMKLNIREITIITEMALTVGLVMLTIGNFLGGQWANESWGRYWGWDPKETWALISIMVYAFVIHMRLVPGLRGRWFFNFMSIVAFASIMMTYFGVNFYLSGLHSYASGDKVITPDFIYYSIAVVVILGALSYWKYKKHYYKGDYNK
jgi:cytochrome c-type biogenesis protein CcsB